MGGWLDRCSAKKKHGHRRDNPVKWENLHSWIFKFKYTCGWSAAKSDSQWGGITTVAAAMIKMNSRSISHTRVFTCQSIFLANMYIVTSFDIFQYHSHPLSSPERRQFTLAVPEIQPAAAVDKVLLDEAMFVMRLIRGCHFWQSACKWSIEIYSNESGSKAATCAA